MIADMMRQFKEAYGENWIAEFKAANPEMTIIVDLVANHTAQEAFSSLKEFVAEQIRESDLSIFAQIPVNTLAMATLNQNERNIYDTHKLLLDVIDKKRF